MLPTFLAQLQNSAQIVLFWCGELCYTLAVHLLGGRSLTRSFLCVSAWLPKV
jgi:hypothetical protein